MSLTIIFVFFVNIVTVLNAFGPPVIIASVAVTTLLTSVHQSISGDSVAIGIINHFSDADLMRDGHYVKDGDFEVIGSQKIAKGGNGGVGGGFDDGVANIGGSAGLVRYYVTDPHGSKTKYCLDIMWGQGSYEVSYYCRDHGCSDFYGFAVALGASRCNTDKTTAFNQFASWVDTYNGAVETNNYGVVNGWNGGDVVMGWEKRHQINNEVRIYSTDNKIAIVADMTNEGEAEIGIDIGPTGWNDCYPQHSCPSGTMDKTNGNSYHWGCGSSCPGSRTDGACNCACISGSTCNGEIGGYNYDYNNDIDDNGNRYFIEISQRSVYGIVAALMILFALRMSYVGCKLDRCRKYKYEHFKQVSGDISVDEDPEIVAINK